VGHTIGGGLEFALARNVTLKGEYLYYNLGKVEVDIGSINFVIPTYATGTFKNKGNIVRMGLNYRF